VDAAICAVPRTERRCGLIAFDGFAGGATFAAAANASATMRRARS